MGPTAPGEGHGAAALALQEGPSVSDSSAPTLVVLWIVKFRSSEVFCWTQSQPWARSCCIKGSCKVFLLILPLGERASREGALSLCKLPLSSSWCSFRISSCPVTTLCWMLATLSTGRGLSSLLSLESSVRRNGDDTSVFEAIV